MRVIFMIAELWHVCSAPAVRCSHVGWKWEEQGHRVWALHLWFISWLQMQ